VIHAAQANAMPRLATLRFALALTLLVPAAASAQGRNPYENLFGRPPEHTGQEYTGLHLNTTAGAQWGQMLEQDFLPPDAVIPEGISGGGDLSLTGQYMRDRVQVLGQGRYSYQEYRQTPAFGAPAFDGGARMNVDVTTKFSVEAGGHYAHSPYFQLHWLEPERTDLPPVSRAAILMMENDTVEANAGVTSRYTKRSSINLSAFMRRTTFAFDGDNDYASRGAQALWHRQMSRDLGLHAGYGREELLQATDGLGQVTVGGDRTFTNERLDIGVDYSRSFSMARRTSLSFATETSMVRENQGDSHFRINGHVEFIRKFQRTWQAQLAAYRATEFLPGFRAPVFSDRLRGSLSGLLAKRVILNVNADGGRGEVGFNDSRRFVSYSADSKVTFAVTRHFGFFTQYLYYRFQNPPDSVTVFFLPRVARQAVSIGIQAWVPLIDKEKVTRDPR